MMQRMRKSMTQKEHGFTLIELLVVIIIIGILAAIAIPVFLKQRKKGVDASLKSDLHNAATNVESWITDNPSADVPTGSTYASTGVGFDAFASGGAIPFKATKGNVITLVPSGTVGAYCIFGYSGAASAAKSYMLQMTYNSQDGGLQPDIVTTTTCA